MSEVTVIQLREALIQYFSVTELKELCMELGEDYESFGGSGKNGKALEIATWSERHGRFDEVVALITRERPHAFAGANVTAAPPTQGGGNVYHIHGNVVGGVLGDGNVNAQNIAGGNFNIDNRPYIAGGDMYVAGGDINIHAPQTKDEFKAQLVELQRLIEKIIADGAFVDEDDANTIISDLKRVTKEAIKEQPNADSMKTRVSDVKRILDDTMDIAKSVGKVAITLAKASALAGVILDTIDELFT